MRNPAYTKSSTVRQIESLFYRRDDFPSIELGNFFGQEFYDRLKKEIKKIKFTPKKHPIGYSCSEAGLTPLMDDAVREIRDFLSHLLKKKLKIDAKLYSFSWRDYTLLHDGAKEKGRYDIIMDFTGTWDGNAGGNIVYADGTGDFSKIAPQRNMLFIAERKKSRKFIQYINHYGKGKRRILLIGTA